MAELVLMASVFAASFLVGGFVITDRINSESHEADLAFVVGACDVINPAAIAVKGTPISGMPILAAHEARQVLVCNLDERPGYSGVQNLLYTDPKTILMFGDAKATLSRLLRALS